MCTVLLTMSKLPLHWVELLTGGRKIDNRLWAWGRKNTLKWVELCLVAQKTQKTSHDPWYYYPFTLSRCRPFMSHNKLPAAGTTPVHSWCHCGFSGFYAISSGRWLWAIQLEMAVVLAFCCPTSSHLPWQSSSSISSLWQPSCAGFSFFIKFCTFCTNWTSM